MTYYVEMWKTTILIDITFKIYVENFPQLMWIVENFF